MEASADLPPVSIVGAGAVGAALALRLVECGYRVEAIFSRRSADAQALADRVEAPVAGSVGDALPGQVGVVMICVPDEAIEAVADALSEVDHPWDDTIAAHTSGVHTASILGPLAERGAATLSFHPLQTFTPDTPPRAFDDIFIGIEGESRALTVGETLAHALGAHPIRLAAEDKVRYHCAAALASNGLVALMSVVREVFVSAGVEASSASDLAAPLVEQTWSNIRRDAPEEVLTGPVARGDLETVKTHLESLGEKMQHLIPLYAVLSTEMVRIARRDGQLNENQTDMMLDTLQTALRNSTTGTNPPNPLH